MIPDFETVPPTATRILRELQAVRDTQKTQAGIAMAVRALGGVAAAGALAMAGYALELASTAAVDHSRVEWLMSQERAAGDRNERLLEAQTRTIAQLEQLQQTVADLRQDVRDLRGAEQRSDDDGRGRR